MDQRTAPAMRAVCQLQDAALQAGWRDEHRKAPPGAAFADGVPAAFSGDNPSYAVTCSR